MTDYVKCKNCGGKIENFPDKCPYCWIKDPVAKQDGFGIYIISALAGALFLIFVNAAMTDNTEDLAAEKREQERIAAKEQQDREKGFHCLSSSDGTNSDVVQAIKMQLKDPASFEHIETKIAPIDERGAHTLIMSYRAKNSFGAYTVGTVSASLRNLKCNVESISIK